MFKIVHEPDFLYEGDLFTCTFYCLTDGGAFPDDQWTDFAATVLSWWANEIGCSVHPQKTAFKLLFEDGPFWIDCSKEGEFVTLRFKTDRHIADVIPEQKICYLDFAREIARAARSLSSSLFLAGHEQDACAMNRIARDIERRLI